jgi:hypothetical protein
VCQGVFGGRRETLGVTSVQNEKKGRIDKKFCSAVCKNNYHSPPSKNENETDEIVETDKILHRNREILAALFEHRPEEDYAQTTLIELAKKGFISDYMTGFYVNSQGKMYRYLYEYAWMLFTHQLVRIYLRKPTKKK